MKSLPETPLSPTTPELSPTMLVLAGRPAFDEAERDPMGMAVRRYAAPPEVEADLAQLVDAQVEQTRLTRQQTRDGRRTLTATYASVAVAVLALVVAVLGQSVPSKPSMRPYPSLASVETWRFLPGT
jgi:hypothetical protein